MENNFDIEKDLSIDQYQLDLEAMSLPSVYFRYADAVREAKALVSEKQDNLKVILAERNIAIRENFAQQNQKVTEGIVTAAVDSDSDVVRARKELREAEATYGRLNVAVQALEVKKSEVDNLVKLFCSSYYASNPAKTSQDFSTEQASAGMRSNMKPVPQINRQ